jgi:hypothetical protein
MFWIKLDPDGLFTVIPPSQCTYSVSPKDGDEPTGVILLIIHLLQNMMLKCIH